LDEQADDVIRQPRRRAQAEIPRLGKIQALHGGITGLNFFSAIALKRS